MEPEITITSNVLMSDGIGKHGPSFFDLLHNDFKLSYNCIGEPNYKDIPKSLFPALASKFGGFGKFSLFTYILGLAENTGYSLGLLNTHKQLRGQCKINIAYTMFESDRITSSWTKILNEYYDFAIVPDQWLVQVYKDSGVNIPIFVIPLGMLLEPFLAADAEPSSDVFTFGMTGSFINRKNHLRVLNAFKHLFGNDNRFELKLHGRFGPLKDRIYDSVVQASIGNVSIDTRVFNSTEYLDFMKNLNCYVFPSKGEGLSITPREAIALGIPTIISNNTAHKTICDSGYAVPVKSEIKEPAVYEYFNNQQIGHCYDCTEEDLITQMKCVIDNYDVAKEQVKPGKEWVKQYLWSSLKPIYVNLFKAQGLALGDVNEITPNTWTTNSKILFEKMKNL
jgi:glycosyltransferase involved in cell wall biosynthesis